VIVLGSMVRQTSCRIGVVRSEAEVFDVMIAMERFPRCAREEPADRRQRQEGHQDEASWPAPHHGLGAVA